MANEEHLNVLSHGVEAWNCWRQDNQTLRPDLSSANLRNGVLEYADLSFGMTEGGCSASVQMRRIVNEVDQSISIVDLNLKYEQHGKAQHSRNLSAEGVANTLGIERNDV